MTPRWQAWARLMMWEALDGGAGSAPYPDLSLVTSPR